jgi:hypothetical protein
MIPDVREERRALVFKNDSYIDDNYDTILKHLRITGV